MAKYRKIPVIVEAEQFHLMSWEKFEGVEEKTVYETLEDGETSGRSATWYVLKTRQGETNICNGDWIITDAKGEKSCCKPDIFEQTYELVEE